VTRHGEAVWPELGLGGVRDEAPKGYCWVWLADPQWTVGGDGHRCRASVGRCHNAAVAGFFRKHGPGFRRWYYCESHLYGRIIEDGVVKFRRLVEMEGTT